MNKKFFIALIFVLSFTIRGNEKMGSVEKDTGIITVHSGMGLVSFFPAHMFPVWFKTHVGKPLPEFRFGDRIDAAGKEYYLFADLWTEQRIIANDSGSFIIECTGTFCTIDSAVAAPGKVKAVYRYELSRNSSFMKISGTITRPYPDNGTLSVCSLNWRYWTAKRLMADGKSIEVQNKFCDPVGELSFDDGHFRFTVRGKKLTAGRLAPGKSIYKWLLSGSRVENWGKSCSFELEISCVELK